MIVWYSEWHRTGPLELHEGEAVGLEGVLTRRSPVPGKYSPYL